MNASLILDADYMVLGAELFITLLIAFTVSDVVNHTVQESDEVRRLKKENAFFIAVSVTQ